MFCFKRIIYQEHIGIHSLGWAEVGRRPRSRKGRSGTGRTWPGSWHQYHLEMIQIDCHYVIDNKWLISFYLKDCNLNSNILLEKVNFMM